MSDGLAASAACNFHGFSQIRKTRKYVNENSKPKLNKFAPVIKAAERLINTLTYITDKWTINKHNNYNNLTGKNYIKLVEVMCKKYFTEKNEL